MKCAWHDQSEGDPILGMKWDCSKVRTGFDAEV